MLNRAFGRITSLVLGVAFLTHCGDHPVAPVAPIVPAPPPPARQLLFSSSAYALDAGDSLQLTVRYDEHGVTQTPTPQVTWSSSAPIDIPVDQTGRVVATVSGGTVTIRAMLDSLIATATVTVRPGAKPMASIIYGRDADYAMAQPFSSVRMVYVDGTSNVRITPYGQPILAWDPSPDGKSIAVMYGSESINGSAYYGRIGGYVLNLATRAETPLVPIMDSPKWSPDGKRIAFRIQPTATQADLYVVSADGSGVKQITKQLGMVAQPAWSPDSRSIAYVNLTLGPVTTHDLWVINADGTGQHQISLSMAGASDPTWSPDGSLITFAAVGSVWTVAPDGTQLRKLISACPGESCSDPFFSSPSWSPDGRQLAYGSLGELLIANADGSSPVSVNTIDVLNGLKRWSPDGSQIVFGGVLRGPDQWPSVFVVDRTGANLRQVTHNENAGSAFWLR